MRVAGILRITLLLGAVCLPVPICRAQLFSITELKGQLRLTNGTSGPAGIQILLENATGAEVARTTTDSRGKFLFTSLSLGIYTVRVHQLGYLRSSQQVDLSFTPSGSVDLTLVPDSKPESITPSSSANPVNLAGLQEPETKTGRAELKKGRGRLFEANDPAGSLPHFAKLIEAEPKYISGHVYQGIALLRLNRASEAESALRDAVKLDSTNFSAQFLLGVCLNQENQFAEAAKSLEKALQQDSTSVEGHYELSRSYLALNRWQDAEPHALEAVKLRADFAPVHVVLGNIDLKKGDAKAALAEYERYLTLDPNGPFAAPTRTMAAKIRSGLGMPPQ